MIALTYEERIRYAGQIPSLGQHQVMRAMEPFREVELCNIAKNEAPAQEQLKYAVFNMEHGYRAEEIVAFLQECPELHETDILFANELDDGTERSGNRNNTEIIAQALHMNYAYGVEFIELNNANDQKGYEGNAVFSKWPIIKAKAFYVPEAYNWYYSEQKRIGGRVSILAEIAVGTQHIGVVCMHLENRCASAGRESQFRASLSQAQQYFGDIPIIVGGDCNTYAFNDLIREESVVQYELLQRGLPRLREVDGEALFETAEACGYDYRSFNDVDAETRRKPMGDRCLSLQLDWIFARGLTCVKHGTISTETAACDWAASDSPIRNCKIKQLSDHNVVYCVAKVRK